MTVASRSFCRRWIIKRLWPLNTTEFPEELKSAYLTRPLLRRYNRRVEDSPPTCLLTKGAFCVMKSTRLKDSDYSRRDFFAIGATLGASVLGSRLFNAGNALATDGAKKYRVVPDWPSEACPRYMARGIDADHRGRIYVACDKQHPVIIISRQGKYLGEWGKGLLLGPHGLRI